MVTAYKTRLSDLKELVWNPYIPHDPTVNPKQLAFLLLMCEELGYGGQAGGGKSDALLMGALQFVDQPNYSALLLRRTFTDLSQEGALIPRSIEWLGGTDAVYNQSQHRWKFPSGSTITFGYMEQERHKYRYASSEYQYIGWDEATQFSSTQYSFMFSRLRRIVGSRIPLRMRSATNPGGVGHDWYKSQFVDGPSPFIRAALADNPFLDRVEYERSLMHLDPLTRKQLMIGDWTARREDSMFKREWFKLIDEAPECERYVLYWDLAATGEDESPDPDYTAGVLVGILDGVYYVLRVWRFRKSSRGVETSIEHAVSPLRVNASIRMEQEPGASGKALIDHYRRRVLLGYDFKGVRPTGSKTVRAMPVASAAEAGNIHLVSGPWVVDFIDELEGFPLGSHDDQVDGLSGAVGQLAQAREWSAF